MNDLSAWIASDLVPALIHGGLGIVGIEQTPFYLFISSPDGLSQLGIDESQPPKLLDAYRKAFKVSSSGGTLTFAFGDIAMLKLGTPHPASGTGQLRVQSWLEWIVDAQPVMDKGYVSRSTLSGKTKSRKLLKYIRLSDPLGGLMLSRGAFGSLGFWRFPVQLLNYEVDWLAQNIGAIIKAIENKLAIFLTIRLS